MNLQVTSNVEAGRALITVAGEVDVSNADGLRVQIDAALANPDIAEVVVNMAAAPYIDSTGIGVLVGSAHKAKDGQKGFSVLDVQPNVLRILCLLGVDEVLDLKNAAD